MSRLYEVLFYDGEASQPAYYLIGGIEGTSATEAMRHNLVALTELAREQLSLGAVYSARRIQGSLYILRDGGLVGAETSQEVAIDS